MGYESSKATPAEKAADYLSRLNKADVDLDIADQSVSHSHTAAGSAEEISGDTAFTAGALVEVVGVDTWVAVGDDAAQAQGGDVKYPAGVPFRVRLADAAATFYLDAATGGEVSVHQVPEDTA